MSRKFNVKKLEKLNDPRRFESVAPERIWDALSLSLCDVTVDIGAGTGLYSREFLRLIGRGKVYACDISDTMITWMRENSREKGFLPVKMDENRIPLDGGISDLVIMMNLHHELDNPDRILKEARRLLKSSGTLCVIDWKRKETSHGPDLDIRVSDHEVQGQLENCGFTGILSHGILTDHYLITGVKA